MTQRMPFPRGGAGWPELREEMVAAKAGDVAWRRGRAPAYIHFAGDEVLAVSKAAFELFFSENALGPRAFPSLARFEREIIEMSLSLLQAPEEAGGCVTTGGTESIFLALKTVRDLARQARPHVAAPNVVAARSAHPAFDKAAHSLGMRVVRVPTTAALQADVAAMATAIDDDTIMLVGSVPAYPFGIVDPIGQLAALALERDVWLHVDACVGGFFAPFAARLGAAIPPFDFSVAGVRSMSADLHKYGYAAKGASVILYRSQRDLEAQSFHFENWPSGRYSTATLGGTRAGGAVASAWAVLRYLGTDGYTEVARRVLATREALEAGVTALGCTVLGDPQLCILAYGGPTLDVPAVAAQLTERGWFVGQTRDPAGIQLMLNLTHEPVVDEYLGDLEDSLEDARNAKSAPAVDVAYS
jgi:glutamate/tyrosine decarboxylase-like PLP-dependent enzyme